MWEAPGFEGELREQNRLIEELTSAAKEMMAAGRQVSPSPSSPSLPLKSLKELAASRNQKRWEIRGLEVELQEQCYRFRMM